MTATPITAIVRAITGGGGTLAGRFIAGYLIAMRPRDKGSGAKLDVTQAAEEGMRPDGSAMAFLKVSLPTRFEPTEEAVSIRK